MLNEWIKDFPWASETQKQGFLHYIEWTRKLKPETREDYEGLCLAAFFIQKDHESNVWWTGVVGEQVKFLQDEIRRLQDEIKEIRRDARACF
jgi:hypothetical protein